MEMYVLGIGLVVIVVHTFTALVMWIAFRLVVTAVKTGILEADEERARRSAPQMPTYGLQGRLRL